MENLYLAIVKALEKKEQVVLATLIHRAGSAPRAVGAQYLVKEDGTSLGSIGGGRVEAEVWQEAKQVMERGEGKVLHFQLTAEQSAEGGSVCGGNIGIFLEPLKQEFLDIYRRVLKIKQKGGSAILATLVSLDHSSVKGRGLKILLGSSGDKVGALLHGELLERRVLSEGESLFKEKKPRVLVVNLENQKAEILLEPIASEPTVYIFGAGHISEQLSPLAKKVHFSVVVIDDRAMFASRERFVDADEIIVSEFESCFDRLSIDESSYLVIVTRGHLYDGLVLERAVQTRARYIGMIGSRKKIQTLYQNLMEKGISKDSLDRVNAPIGLDINSETPEEIAVSIVAELIKVRGQRVIANGFLLKSDLTPY